MALMEDSGPTTIDEEEAWESVDLVVPEEEHEDSSGGEKADIADDDEAAFSLSPSDTHDYISMVLTTLFEMRTLGPIQERRMMHLMRTHPWAPEMLAKGMDRHRASSRRQCVGPHAYAVLSNLISLALEVCGIAGEYRTAKTLMHMACTFHRVAASTAVDSGENVREYLQSAVRRPSYLDDDDFWRDVFFDAVNAERVPWDVVEVEEESTTAIVGENDLHDVADVQIVFSQLTTLAYTMLQWGLGLDRVKDFVQRQCEVNRVPEDMQIIMRESLEGFRDSVKYGGMSDEDRVRWQMRRDKEAWLAERKGSWKRRTAERMDSQDDRPTIPASLISGVIDHHQPDPDEGTLRADVRGQVQSKLMSQLLDGLKEEDMDTEAHVNALVAAAADHLRDTRFENALNLLSSALDLLPNHIGARVNRAVVFASLERPSEALEDLNVALKIDPDNMAVRYNRAEVFDQLEMDEEATQERRIVGELRIERERRTSWDEE